MYADDTSPTFQTTNDDLKHLDLWMEGHKLSLHVSKTQSMLICTKPKHQILKTAGDNLCLNTWGKGLDVVQKVKHFGVQVENSLDGKEQIKVISSKISKVVGLLKHAKTFLPESSLRSLYFSIVEPQSHYSCSVWGCSASNIFLEPQKLQNRVARILKNSASDAPRSPIIEKYCNGSEATKYISCRPPQNKMFSIQTYMEFIGLVNTHYQM